MKKSHHFNQNIDSIELGLKIRTLRKFNLIKSADELAEKLNISKPHVYRLESGRCLPSLSLLVEISKLFNVSLDYLVFGRTK